ncbi:Glutamate--tRNA ligase [Frankliniella fusca]|uniref:Glutamate--tRNA ligase n=1 Tax=Frankliniella fusca TaxID=407009 RepID=A0AAE1I1W8_9NEOP|nr:Glutamate--tRNA ligase [Frankliniella fusca]
MSQHQENTLPRNAKPRLLFNPEDNVQKLHTEVIHDPTISSREDCSAYGVILPLHGRSHRVLGLNAPGHPPPPASDPPNNNGRCRSEMGPEEGLPRCVPFRLPVDQHYPWHCPP